MVFEVTRPSGSGGIVAILNMINILALQMKQETSVSPQRETITRVKILPNI